MKQPTTQMPKAMRMPYPLIYLVATVPNWAPTAAPHSMIITAISDTRPL
jgi:hypothetical protein